MSNHRKGVFMKNALKFFGITALFAVIVLSMSGCVTDTSNWHAYWNAQPVRLERAAYTLLGEVRIERSWTRVLGLFESGGITYAEFLDEARRIYRDTDAIIDVHLDAIISSNPFFSKRRYIAIGYAVQYK